MKKTKANSILLFMQEKAGQVFPVEQSMLSCRQSCNKRKSF